MRFLISTIAWLFLGSVLIGCGNKETPSLTVKGTVTFDGEPISEGYIVFAHANTDIRSEGAAIKDGSYRIKVREGRYKVSIQASRLTPLPPGKKGPHGESEMHRDYIPEKYNSNTELTADISESATVNFDLKSK